MEDLDDNLSCSGFEPLFIQEENGDVHLEQRVESNKAQSVLTFAETHLNQSALIGPYLQEMDELLKSCEQLAGIPFGSHFSTEYNETSQCESTKSKEEVMMESDTETGTFPNTYVPTSYIDTHMDNATTEDPPEQGQSQGVSSIVNGCGATTDVSQPTDMPLTSAGNKLSNTMVEYEGQLVGMLAMLESCMEEAGMDFEPQDWATDGSQEYVHIRKNPHRYRSTTLVPTQQGKTLKLESQEAPVQCWAGQHATEEDVPKEGRNLREVGSGTDGNQQTPLFSGANMSGSSVDNIETGDPLVDKEDDPMHCDGIKPGYMSTNKGAYREEGVTEMDVEETGFKHEHISSQNTESSDLRSDMNELGSQMEACIEDVQRLENRRKELLLEVLQLRGHKAGEEEEENKEEETEEHISNKVAELMITLKREEEGRREERKREIQSLKDERAEEERKLWKVNLERLGLHEDLRKLKRRLFAVARECAHGQASLNKQHHEVELLKKEEEKLQSLVLQMTEGGSQLRSAHQQQLLSLQAELHAQIASRTSNTQEMTQCKRNSCGDVQQYMQGSLRALEERYEPILLALQKRREATAGALIKANEQAEEMRAQLRPLRGEIEKLELQRACLEEKLKLTHLQRKEDMGQYKETVRGLEESSKELKTELTIQQRKTREIGELRDRLTKQLLSYRAAIEDQECDNEEET